MKQGKKHRVVHIVMLVKHVHALDQSMESQHVYKLKSQLSNKFANQLEIKCCTCARGAKRLQMGWII